LRSRRRPLRGIVSLTIAAAIAFSCLAVWPGRAHGTIGRGLIARVTEAPVGSPMLGPGPVGVDNATSLVFVADLGTGDIDVFTTAGEYVTQFGDGMLFASGIAVDESSGLIYVADSLTDSMIVFRSSGTGYAQVGEWTGASVPGGEFSQLAGVAVDNSDGPSAGVIYVVDATNGTAGAVFALRPKPAGPEEGLEGALVGTLKNGTMERPNGVAVNSATGTVYVADARSGAIYEFDAEGAFERKLTGAGSPQGPFLGKLNEEGNVAAVAVDPTNGDLLVAEAERDVVDEFDATGEWRGWIPSGPNLQLDQPQGVDAGQNGYAYVGNTDAGELDILGVAAPVPGATTGKAQKVTRTSATVAGTVAGDGKPDRYFVQWGSSPALGSRTTPVAQAGGEENVQVACGELKAGTVYFYRLVTEDEDGVSYGLTRELTTLPAVEAESTGPAQSLQPTAATLTGTLTPDGADTHYLFQWGTNDGYGHTSPEAPGTDAGAGLEAVAASTSISGLAPNYSYHYRLVATNSFGTTYGSDQQFTTPGPPRVAQQPPSAIGREEATINAVLRPDELATSYHVEYGETAGYGQETAPEGAGAEETSVPVAVPIAGLAPGDTYHYRLVATNEAGTARGPDETVTTLSAAIIAREAATDISAGEATIRAQVAPLGRDTTVQAQYGTTSCETDGCVSTASVDIGAGQGEVPVSQQLGGLAANTAYHYRVIATNSLGTATGPEQSFTTGAAAIADGRAWEMVTPPDKHGAEVEALTREGGIILASENGEQLTYVVDGAIGTGEGDRSPEPSQILAARQAGGWTTQNITTPNEAAQGISPGSPPEYQYFTPDLSTALVEPVGNPPAPPLAPGVTQATPFLRDNATGRFLPLVTEANVAAGTEFGVQVAFAGATPDLQHVVLSSTVPLEGHGSTPGLYEWSAGELKLVSILPHGQLVKTVGAVQLGYSHTAANAISGDGSRVIWTTSETESHLGHLYLRDTVRDETIQLDAAQRVPQPRGAGEARFQTASSDGSRIFFTDSQDLTPNATAGPANPDLYECEVTVEAGRSVCRLRDLTPDAIPEEHADVQGSVLGIGESGTDVYLVAHGILAENQNGNGETAEAGAENLYALHYDGSEWNTLFIARLSPEDEPEWEGNRLADTAFLTARVSSNGRYLAFMSAAAPTGYDNVDQYAGRPDEEVYLYDSGSADLLCVSCNPSGARPVGVLDRVESGEGLGLLVDRRKVWAEAGREHWLAGNIPGWTAQSLTTATLQPRYLSNEGRLYFNSPDDLVPAATNHEEDVYEYEPSGVGSCQSSTGGCVALLSGGSSDRESAFLEATPSGSSVFFLTEAQLLPQDTDTAFDIYDARECTAASPCLTPPAPTPSGCVEISTCRPAEPAQPLPQGGGQGTASYAGPGNPALPPAAKQQVRDDKAAKRLTRAQLLTRALRSCRKLHNRRRREDCEAHARRLYGPPHKRQAPSARRANGHARKGRQ